MRMRFILLRKINLSICEPLCERVWEYFRVQQIIHDLSRCCIDTVELSRSENYLLRFAGSAMKKAVRANDNQCFHFQDHGDKI